MSTVTDEDDVSEDDQMEEQKTRQPSFFAEMDEDLPEHMKHYDEAIAKVRGLFQGVRVKLGKAPQTAKWAHEAMQAALEAVGGADEDSVVISSKLLDPKIPCVAAVNKVCAKIEELKTDKRYTLPHIRPGVRLVKMGDGLDLMEQLFRALEECKVQLAAAAQEMYYEMAGIRAHMQQKLKGLYNPKNYDFDPRLRYHLSWAPEDVYVPSYLKHNAFLHEAADKQIQTELRQTMAATEAQLAQGVFTMIDTLVERLESRRLLDRKHEIVSAETGSDGSMFHVSYRDADVKEGAKPLRDVVLTQEEFKARVTDDDRRKGFKDATAAKLYDEVAYVNKELAEIGLAQGEVGDAFKRLKKLLGGNDKKSLPAALKQSEAYRQGFSKSLSKIGAKFLDLSVLQGKRDIIRASAKSTEFNPDKV